MNPCRILAAAALVSMFAAPAAGQPVRADNAEVELVAAVDAVVPGRPLSVALRIKHDPGWHTYWQVPGDSGLPTKIGWKLPSGWTAGPIQWPVPRRLPVGPLVNFGYEGEILLAAELEPPGGLAAGEQVEFAARADFLICREVCIPSGADLELRLPVREAAGPSRRAALFASMRAMVPRPAALAGASAAIDDNRIRVSFKPPAPVGTLEFFPLEEARLEPSAPQVLQQEDGRAALYLSAARPVAPGFERLRGVLVADGGPARADRGGWAATVELPLARAAVPAISAGQPALAAGPDEAAPQSPVTLWIAVIGALVGGMLLNLMPCVFPVLSLKLLSLLQHQRAEDSAGVRHPPLRAHGMAFGAGVVSSFLLLAGVLLALRAGGEQLGWGFQLQSPWVIAALTSLFFLIGLNLVGVFEVIAGGGIASGAQRIRVDRLSGSFATGVLAVVVAAPCTAPFMGAALGYAITQPSAIAALVFAVLGIGMAMPYVLLTFFPALLARLPRPGAWMERFKQAMAFPMFATCVWLLWVLAQQVNVNALAITLGALVLLALAAWAFGLAQRGARGWRWVAMGAAAVAVYAVLAATGETMRGGAAVAAGSGASWQPWSPAAQREHLAAGKPVFVDFTAAWCVTCQANKQLVLNAAAVARALNERQVALLRADWTNRDDAITRELARFGRNGVPLYVVYDGDGRSEVLPELLTEGIVLDALSRL